MAGAACLVFDERLTKYDFGPRHPLAPIRVDLTIRLARALDLLADDEGGAEVDDAGGAAGAGNADGADGAGGGGLPVVPAPMGTDEQVLSVHEEAYVDAVRRCGGAPEQEDLSFGLGTADNPTFAGMHEASAHVVGASIEAARQVWSGRRLHAANVAGGLHHAMPGAAAGFCVYNDPAAAIRWLLDQGCARVAYVDLDVHHGDGVQTVFYDDPRVLTVSLHESPRTLFPWVSGEPTELGGPGAEGYAVNVALPPATTDPGWLRAFHAVVPPLLEAFEPTILVSQHGCDGHGLDPLAHLELTVDGQRAAYTAVHELAHRHCEGRWVALGGGGYALVDVVPRAWTHLLGILASTPVHGSTVTPPEWRDHVLTTLEREAPSFMGDGGEPSYVDWLTGYDPGDSLDRAILATRTATFPYHGLNPQL